MRFLAGAISLLIAVCWLLPAQSSPKHPLIGEKLTFDVEWRLIHAGTAVIESENAQARMKIESAGLVSSLYRVEDTYSANYDESYCATSTQMDSQEGKRHRETKVTYDRAQNRASFMEWDLIKNTVLRSAEVETPSCVSDVVGSLLHIRNLAIEPGASTQLPISDGRRSAEVRVEAQAREGVTTPAGKFQAVRYEAYLLNGVVYQRKGRVFVWLTDDARRLPVQIRLGMQFPIGTVTLQLQKEEHL
jgi:hypothetical protein